MDRPGDSQKPVRANTNNEKSAKSDYRTSYLIFYNFVSAILWSVVLGGVVYTSTIRGTRNVHAAFGESTKWTQTLAGLEVVHSLLGIVRAPILTTVMQVASRFLLVWGIVNQFPDVTGLNLAYSTMLIAWSTTEVIRYSYFAVNLTNGKVPAFLTWLRYNTFFVLYPLGICSECWLVWLATYPASKRMPGSEWALYAILAIYVPGAYVLFTHMMAQRRKIMRASSKKKAR